MITDSLTRQLPPLQSGSLYRLGGQLVTFLYRRTPTVAVVKTTNGQTLEAYAWTLEPAPSS